METKPHYYSNPAFCQQSETYAKSLSPQRGLRQSPVGALTVPRIVDEELGVQEQEFYEEVVVDDRGFITDKKFVVVAQDDEGKKYIRTPQEEQRRGTRYAAPGPKRKEARVARSQSHRYEYIPMRQQEATTPRTSPQKSYAQDDIQVSPARVHRYAVIDAEEETELITKTSPTRYALVPVDYVPNKPRYEYLQDSPNRYEPVQNRNRYEYIQHQQPRSGNPIATQKLHELLSTPKRPPIAQKVLSPQTARRQTPPKAQQKLNYAIGTRQLASQQLEKRNTAIVAPLCSSPVQSIYGETTIGSCSNLSVRKDSVQVTLTFAALVMLICGLATSGLGFYMNYAMGRHYFLDFGIVAGFTCLVLGLLGFRTRNIYWLPNRNYISGYLLLTVFSMLTCAGLLVLLLMRPRPGTPLADMTSGAVCGISVFSLMLAAMGIISSYCCKYPPPDNRVQHCAEGFSV